MIQRAGPVLFSMERRILPRIRVPRSYSAEGACVHRSRPGREFLNLFCESAPSIGNKRVSEHGARLDGSTEIQKLPDISWRVPAVSRGLVMWSNYHHLGGRMGEHSQSPDDLYSSAKTPALHQGDLFRTNDTPSRRACGSNQNPPHAPADCSSCTDI